MDIFKEATGGLLFLFFKLKNLSICDISCYFTFTSDFIHLGPLSWFFDNLVKGSPILFIFSNNYLLVSLILYLVLVLF